MRKTIIKLLCRVSVFLAVFCMCAGPALCEIVYYVNPDGGYRTALNRLKEAAEQNNEE